MSDAYGSCIFKNLHVVTRELKDKMFKLCVNIIVFL